MNRKRVTPTLIQIMRDLLCYTFSHPLRNANIKPNVARPSRNIAGSQTVRFISIFQRPKTYSQRERLSSRQTLKQFPGREPFDSVTAGHEKTSAFTDVRGAKWQPCNLPEQSCSLPNAIHHAILAPAEQFPNASLSPKGDRPQMLCHGSQRQGGQKTQGADEHHYRESECAKRQRIAGQGADSGGFSALGSEAASQ
jgi:hypothetical protein